jgi:hypothetical protein
VKLNWKARFVPVERPTAAIRARCGKYRNLTVRPGELIAEIESSLESHDDVDGLPDLRLSCRDAHAFDGKHFRGRRTGRDHDAQRA